MKFYKVIMNNEFVGIGTSLNLRKYQEKHGIPLICGEEEVQYIQIEEDMYHAMWMVPETIKGLYPTADVIEIDEQEYDAIKYIIESGETVEPEEDETQTDEPEIPAEPEIEEDVTLEYVKEKKISEMSSMSEKSIHAGADIVLADGNTYHFSFTDQDQYQIGFLATSAKTAAMLETMNLDTGETGMDYPWHADGGDCIFYSRADMITIGTAMQNTITYHNSYFHSLRNYIQSITDIQETAAITYGTEVPEKYWGDVYRNIMTGGIENES